MSNWDAPVVITKKLATDVDAWLDVAISSIESMRKRDLVMKLQDGLRKAVAKTDNNTASKELIAEMKALCEVADKYEADYVD